MKGVIFLGNRRLEVREFPMPTPNDDEVLIRIMATGICGSDLHRYRGEIPSQQINGHEPCGIVERVGAHVKHLREGDRVTVHHHYGCGTCAFCARGEVVACPNHPITGVTTPGSFAEFIVAPERACIPLPDVVSFVDGAFMACVGGTAFGALRRLGATAHETVAVFGLGPVGLSCVLMAKAMGLRVIGVDVAAERVALALQCGADEAVNAMETDTVSAAQTFARRVTGIANVNGVDYVIETSGSAQGRSNVIPSLRRGGAAAIVGVGSNEKVINPSDIHGKACTLIGSVVFPMGWSWDLARFLATSGLTFEPAVTHRFTLEEAETALRMADEGKSGKVLFVPNVS